MLYLIDEKDLTGSGIDKTYNGLDFTSLFIVNSVPIITYYFSLFDGKNWGDPFERRQNLTLILHRPFKKLRVQADPVGATMKIYCSTDVKEFVFV